MTNNVSSYFHVFMNYFSPSNFFNLGTFAHKALFDNTENVWEVFARVPQYLEAFFKRLPKEERIKGVVRPGAILVGDDIYIGDGAKIEPTAYIEGPTVIGPRSIVGTGAYIRGGTILGEQAIIGHCTEAKNTIMLNNAAAPHFNFIGDSILGNSVNIGAGVILANYRLDAKAVPAGDTSTGLTKFGAILGDRVKVGCNAVLEPGTFLGKDTWVSPCSYLRRGCYEKGERHADLVKKI